MTREEAILTRCKLRMVPPAETDPRYTEYESNPSEYQNCYGCPCVSSAECVINARSN